MEKNPQVIVEVTFWDKLSFHPLSKKPNNREKKILRFSLTIADHSDSVWLFTQRHWYNNLYKSIVSFKSYCRAAD